MSVFYKLLFKIFGGLAKKLLEGLEPLKPYQEPAYRLVKKAAEIAKVRSAETVEQVAQMYGVQVTVDGNLTRDELGKILQAIVFAVLQRQFPEAPTRRLNRAIENALGMVNP